MTRDSQSREYQSLDKYLEEIGKVPLLTLAEEVELAKRIKDGDQLALETLTGANLLFVVSIAKKYRNKGLPFGDLINEGNLGLMKAARRFDETRGFKFISYAVWWIRQAILQALAEQSRIVRLPLNRVSAVTKVGKISSALEQEFEREPSAIEIAEQLDMTEYEVTDTLKIAGRHLSLDIPFSNSEENCLLDVIGNNNQPPPDADLIGQSLKDAIEHALTILTKREADILRLYFGLGQESPLKLEEIGERYNLTRERIRQIKVRAIHRLGHVSRRRALRAFLG